MSAAAKLVLGVILVLVGLWLLLPAGAVENVKPEEGVSAELDWWKPFKTVVTGMIPPVLIVIGALVVWIEAEEMKAPEVPEIEEDFDIEEEVEKEGEEE
ncbi:MAG: hypothetical protein ACLFTQ_02440 [Candidatus Aenigmatarchaeota archaeon]